MKQTIIITDYESKKHAVEIEIVQPGFIDVYGCKWSKSQCFQYNKLSIEIAQMKYCNSSRVELAMNDRHMLYHLPIYTATKHLIDSQSLTV